MSINCNVNFVSDRPHFCETFLTDVTEWCDSTEDWLLLPAVRTVLCWKVRSTFFSFVLCSVARTTRRAWLRCSKYIRKVSIQVVSVFENRCSISVRATKGPLPKKSHVHRLVCYEQLTDTSNWFSVCFHLLQKLKSVWQDLHVHDIFTKKIVSNCNGILWTIRKVGQRCWDRLGLVGDPQCNWKRGSFHVPLLAGQIGFPIKWWKISLAWSTETTELEPFKGTMARDSIHQCKGQTGSWFRWISGWTFLLKQVQKQKGMQVPSDSWLWSLEFHWKCCVDESSESARQITQMNDVPWLGWETHLSQLRGICRVACFECGRGCMWWTQLD